MEEIICPNFYKAFKVDDAGYANIVNQIRDHEFSRDLEEKIESLAAQHQVDSSRKTLMPKKFWKKPYVLKILRLRGLMVQQRMLN